MDERQMHTRIASKVDFSPLYNAIRHSMVAKTAGGRSRSYMAPSAARGNGATHNNTRVHPCRYLIHGTISL